MAKDGNGGSINVNNPVTWSSGGALTLTADTNINVNAKITGSGAASALTLRAGYDINIYAPSPFVVNPLTADAGNNINIKAAQGWTTAGSWAFTAANSIFVYDTVNWSENTPLALSAYSAININAAITGSGALGLNAGTDVSINAPSTLAVNTLTATASDNININGPQSWTARGSWTFTGNNINISDIPNWTTGALALNAGANIFVNNLMTATGSGSLVATYGSGANANGSPNGLYMSLDTSGSYTGRIYFSSNGRVTLQGQNYTAINRLRILMRSRKIQLRITCLAPVSSI
ncbi:hypothetical protein [Methylocapsa acidiphila]|uniref:hypothetical protein n=1 Tax=Methylocapsa acidiphila TaxID=133552 RepID=UPI0018DC3742|nr:hypothetical protein [Methylocapsa acidiphila]